MVMNQGGDCMVKCKIWEEKIPFYNPDFQNEQNKGTNIIKYYKAQADEPRPAVVIFPGGAYWGRADDHEGEKIAKFYNAHGINAAVVEYRVAPYRYPIPLMDAQRAIKVMRSKTIEWNICAGQIAAIGFSAGGHLCAMTGLYEDLSRRVGDISDMYESKPDLMILCYPVLSADREIWHQGSFENLLGEEDLFMARNFSMEDFVNENTPPCFIWHTAEDETVPVQNSLRFANSLIKEGGYCEMHIFPKGYHGVGLGVPEFPGVEQWGELSVNFIKNTFKTNF